MSKNTTRGCRDHSLQYNAFNGFMSYLLPRLKTNDLSVLSQEELNATNKLCDLSRRAYDNKTDYSRASRLAQKILYKLSEE